MSLISSELHDLDHLTYGRITQGFIVKGEFRPEGCSFYFYEEYFDHFNVNLITAFSLFKLQECLKALTFDLMVFKFHGFSLAYVKTVSNKILNSP